MCYIIILHNQNIYAEALSFPTLTKRINWFLFFFVWFFCVGLFCFFILFLHYSHQFLFSFVLCVRYVPGMRSSSVLRSTTAVWLFQSARGFSVVGRGLIRLEIATRRQHNLHFVPTKKCAVSMDTRDRIIEFKILWGISNIARSNIDGKYIQILRREREREVHYMTSVPILRLDIGLHHFFHLFVIFIFFIGSRYQRKK